METKTVQPNIQHYIHAFAITDTGKVRLQNEDSVYSFVAEQIYPPRALFLVADGMGGHEFGEVASQMAIEIISQELEDFLQATDDSGFDKEVGSAEGLREQAQYLFQRLHLAIHKANDAIYGANDPAKEKYMGTTATAVMIHGNIAVVANVGDSRTYHWRDNELRQITQDHSLVGHLIRTGRLKEIAYYEHPRRHLITRALGNESSVEIDFWAIQLQPNDYILLCSDGLWEMIRDMNSAVAESLALNDLEKTSHYLVELAKENGGVDNIGLVLAQVTTDDVSL